MASNQSWEKDLESYPDHFQRLIKNKVAEEDDTQTPQPAQQPFEPIIPAELWKIPEPPQINITIHKDHYTGAMLMVAFGTVLAPIALVALIVLSAVPGFLLAFAAGIATASGLALLKRSNHDKE